MTQPLRVQFGSGAITLTCLETAVVNRLKHHLKNCRGQPGPTIAVYQIRQSSPGWQLQRNETLLLTAKVPEALFEPFLQDALTQLIIPEQDHLVFHAGGVSGDNQGIMLCGQTGAGKSTLVAQLTASGFRYLTDEAVAIPLSTRSMTGFARSLVLKPGSEFLWRDAAACADLLPLPGGFTWAAPTFFQKDCVQHTAVLTRLLFPQFKLGCPLTVQPLTAAEAAFQLMQHLVNARNLPDKGFTAVTQLAKRLPAFAVQHGDGRVLAEWLKQAR